MSLTVNQRPSTTISGEAAKWNAVGNPILYKMQRKDFTFASITNSGGFVRLVLDSGFGDVSTSFDVDDVVYFQTDAGVYATTGNVTASSYSAPNTLVTLDTAYISSSTGWVNNETLRPLYRVEVEVYDSGGTALSDAPFMYSPTISGLITIDVRAILRANLEADNDADLTGSTEIFDESNVYKKFYIKYREVWTGSAESQTNDSSNQFFAVLGAMQIPSTYGGNMAIYTTFNDGSPVASFLTKLNTIIFWAGYPNLLTVIVGDNATSNVQFKSSADSTTAAAYDGKIVSVDLNELITDQTVKTETIALYKDGAPDVILTESKSIKIREACENPVYVVGRNSLGGVLSWMFDITQEYTLEDSEGRKAKRLICMANNLNINEWEALQDFIVDKPIYRNNVTELTSSVIKNKSVIGQQLYVVDSSGNKTGVVSIKVRNRTMTHRITHRFEIEIEYPETFSI